MVDPPRSPQTDEETGRRPDRGAAGGVPRWLLASGIMIAIALVGLMVFLHLTGALGPSAH